MFEWDEHSSFILRLKKFCKAGCKREKNNSKFCENNVLYINVIDIVLIEQHLLSQKKKKIYLPIS